MSIIDPQKIRSEHLEKVLAECATEWTLEIVQLEALGIAEGGQVRAAEHRAPKDRVKEYQTKVEAGSFPPPLIVNKQGLVLDGNTRRESLVGAKWLEYAAYVVDVTDVNRMIQIGALANEHGQPLTQAEKLAAVRAALSDGVPASKVAARYGFNPKTVAALVAQQTFELRCMRMGIDPTTVKTKATKELVPLALDGPFREALVLAEDTGMTVVDVRHLVKEVKPLASEREQLDRIALERETRREQIAAHASGAERPRPSHSARARSRYAWILGRKPRELVELDPAKYWAARGEAERLAEHFRQVLAEFASVERNMPTRPLPEAGELAA